MNSKLFLVFCYSALFIQITSAQCVGNPIFNPVLDGLYGPGFGAPLSGCGIAPTSGGGFLVTSSSPIAPTGISVASENAIEGSIAVAGELPFLGAIALEGALPTAGAGSISYGCGNGNVAIIIEGVAPAVGPIGPTFSGLPGGLGFGPGPGLGCGPGLGFGGLSFGGIY